ncbi:MAG: peptidyl-prolyl cis-trans isomerase [Acidobacteriia bacterium]|nr:peptidyl-prolyl cis-trans isomerase [Terriglobia bacterium]
MRRHAWRLTTLVFVLGVGFTASLAHAQNQAPVASSPAAESPAAVHRAEAEADDVSPGTPVITLEGLCDPASATAMTHKKPCRTVITRSEFEELAEASDADSGAARTQFANFFAKFSLLAREAQKRGMDQDPVFQRKLELARIQLLGQILIRDLQAKSNQFTPGELENFFRENPALFEQAAIQRVYIPKTKFKDLPNGVQQPIPESAPEMKLVAEALLARARTGADFETLQKEALDTANLKAEHDANLGKMSRDHLRRTHQVVFDLKPGEVSALFEEPDEGYYIYRMGSREMPSFEATKSDAATAFQKRRMDTWMNNITGPAKMNQQYFGAAAAGSSPAQ